jgi:polysaccharide deacetylase 2 family uncharacterized protein YibQ
VSVTVGAALISLSEKLPEMAETIGTIIVSDDVRAVVSRDAAPKIAIVLDDCGANLEMARRVLSTGIPVTWAIIPNLKYSKETAELLRGAGAPFLVHVPMQAVIDPPDRAGRGGLYSIGTGMSADEVRSVLVPMLDEMDGAIGINNHRGSKATADQSVMNAVMTVLAERGLFFLDSRTSVESVAYDTAVKHGLDAAYNSRFLDNQSERGKIAAEMNGALKSASRKGVVAVICHLRPETVAFLENFAKECGNGIHKSGVEFITLAEWPGYAKEEER